MAFSSFRALISSSVESEETEDEDVKEKNAKKAKKSTSWYVRFEVEDEVITVDRKLLLLKSGYFKRLFSEEPEEGKVGDKTIKLDDDVKKKPFRLMVKFLNAKCKDSDIQFNDHSLIRQLLHMSRKFEVKLLENHLRDKLIRRLPGDDLLIVYIISIEEEIEDLRKACLRYFDINRVLSWIFETSLLHLPVMAMTDFLEHLYRIEIPPNIILVVVLRWVQSDIMDRISFLSKVPLNRFTITDLVLDVYPSKLFDNELYWDAVKWRIENNTEEKYKYLDSNKVHLSFPKPNCLLGIMFENVNNVKYISQFTQQDLRFFSKERLVVNTLTIYTRNDLNTSFDFEVSEDGRYWKKVNFVRIDDDTSFLVKTFHFNPILIFNVKITATHCFSLITGESSDRFYIKSVTCHYDNERIKLILNQAVLSILTKLNSERGTKRETKQAKDSAVDSQEIPDLVSENKDASDMIVEGTENNDYQVNVAVQSALTPECTLLNDEYHAKKAAFIASEETFKQAPNGLGQSENTEPHEATDVLSQLSMNTQLSFLSDNERMKKVALKVTDESFDKLKDDLGLV